MWLSESRVQHHSQGQLMTREETLAELIEIQKDLDAFTRARYAVEERVRELEGTSRKELFLGWAMTQVILNAHIMAVVRCQGLVEDYRKILETMDTPDNVVRLVRDEGDQK
jgi:hypothetical protein